MLKYLIVGGIMKSSIKRNSSFELLRIIAILMVLILHYFNGGMGGALNNVKVNSFNYYSVYIIESLSIIAVNLFILISGYFMCKKKEVKINKALNLIILTSLYSVGFYILSIFMGSSKFSFGELVYAFIPFTYGSKWFIGSYAVLSIISPYLNIIFENLNKKEMKRLSAILVIAISIVPTLLNNISYNDNGYGVLSFIMLYTIGSYIRLHYKEEKNILMYCIGYVVFAALTFGYSLISDKAWNYNSIFNVISSITFFLIFTKIKIKSRFINKLATFSFAIYVIHTEPRISSILYKTILRCNQFWNSKLFLIHMIISVIIIYLICISIEYTRRVIFKILKINI